MASGNLTHCRGKWMAIEEMGRSSTFGHHFPWLLFNDQRGIEVVSITWNTMGFDMT
jgi:hypothetical protein